MTPPDRPPDVHESVRGDGPVSAVQTEDGPTPTAVAHPRAEIAAGDAEAWQSAIGNAGTRSEWHDRVGPAAQANPTSDRFSPAEAHVAEGLHNLDVDPYEVHSWNSSGVEWWGTLYDGKPWNELSRQEQEGRVDEVRDAHHDRVAQRHDTPASAALLGREFGSVDDPPLVPGGGLEPAAPDGLTLGASDSNAEAKRSALLATPGASGPAGQLAKREGVASGDVPAAPASKSAAKEAKRAADKEQDRADGRLKAPGRKLKREVKEQANSGKTTDKIANAVATEGLTKVADALLPGSGTVVRPLAEKIAPAVVVGIKKDIQFRIKLVKLGGLVAIGVVISMIAVASTIFGGVGGAPQQQTGTRSRSAETIPANYKSAYEGAAKEHNLPWSMLAAVGWTASDHGRQNAYNIKYAAQAAADASTSASDPAEGGLPDDVLADLRECESTGNYQIVSAIGYYGAYQFHQTTWNATADKWFPALSGIKPSEAPPVDQDAMARALFDDYGQGQWECFTNTALGDRQAHVDPATVTPYKPKSNIPPSQRLTATATSEDPAEPGGGPAFYQQEGPAPTTEPASVESTTTSSTPPADATSPFDAFAGGLPPDAYSRSVWPIVEPSIVGENGAGPFLLNYGITGKPQDVANSTDVAAEQMSILLDEELSGTGLSRDEVVASPFIEAHVAVWLRVLDRMPVDKQTAEKRAGLGGGSATSRGGSPFTGDVSELIAAGVPENAARAYMNAVEKAAEEDPTCTIPISFLMSFGFVESGHGSHAGATMSDTGDVDPWVIGPVLDGSPGVAAIRDSDGGKWDRDTTWDRAVGPMQFIPQTWTSMGRDGNDDGDKNPHNYYDATYASSMLLCRTAADNGGIMTDAGQRAAAFAYNHSQEYVRQVMSHAEDYARKLGTGSGGSADPEALPVGVTSTTVTATPATTVPAGGSQPTPSGDTGTAPRPKKVIAIGDSLLAGTCVNTNYLQDKLSGIPVDCRARVGSPTSWGLAELESVAADIDGETAVLVVLGHNGASADYPAQLKQILDLAAPAMKIVLMTNTEWESEVTEYVNPAIRDAAKTNPKVTIADWVALYESDPSLLASDGVHAANYQRLAQLLADSVLNGKGSTASMASASSGLMKFPQATYSVAAVYSGVADEGILKIAVGDSASTVGMNLATAGSYTVPLAKSYFDSHPTAVTTDTHHTYPAADFAIPTGTAVYAVTNGVISNLSGGACGVGVTLHGDDGTYYVYCHGVAEWEGGPGMLVKPGDKITVGQQIMWSGNTGRSTGPHLHFQVTTTSQTHLCPQPLMKAWLEGVPRVPGMDVQKDCPDGQVGVTGR